MISSFLIPFFLTTNILVEEPWQYGPEYKFLGKMRIKIEGVKNGNNHMFAANCTTEMTCRPKGSDSLSCYLGEFEAAMAQETPDTDGVQYHVILDKPGNSWMRNQVFELKFDEKGAQFVVVPKPWCGSSDEMKIVIIQLISTLLSVGTDLTGHTDGKFSEQQEFFYGDCTANYDLRHTDDDEAKGNTTNFKLVLEPKMKDAGGKRLVMTRHWDVDHCKFYNKALFMFFAIFSESDGEGMYNITNSNRMEITSNEFSSETHLSAILPDKLSSATGRLDEYYSLKLISVGPAASELPIIENPITNSTRIDPFNNV